MDRVEQIVQMVCEKPGIRFSELMRETGLKNGVLSHHLSKIEQSGRITVERTPRVARLYPCGMPQEETLVIKHLKNPTARKILTALLDGDFTFKELVNKVKKSQGTVSLSLKILYEDQLVERKLDDGHLIFQLTNKDLLDSIIEKQPSFIENSANNISDIFSSI
jgi:DNA-binding HxlR family transcriptional regulator